MGIISFSFRRRRPTKMPTYNLPVHSLSDRTRQACFVR